MSEVKKISGDVVDIFCGIGGLSHGLKQKGFNIIAGYDLDRSCRYAYETNNGAAFYERDISSLTGEEVKKQFRNEMVKILVGCAPCQQFSSYTFKEKVKDTNKWGLLYHFSRIILESEPDIVSMENVPTLLHFKDAPVFKDFLNSLKHAGYHTHYEIVDCLAYGIPQSRKRLVLLASKLGEIRLIEKTHTVNEFVTVRDTIGKMSILKDGETDKEDELHFARKLSELNKKRIESTPYGGSWKDWPENLKLECHKKQSGKSYPSVYGRMKWEEPSPTITTHCVGYGNGRFGHPEQNRAISLREAALFQTFPFNYRFFEKGKKYSSVTIARQLGNAVPVRLGEVIGMSIQEHLKTTFDGNAFSGSDYRGKSTSRSTDHRSEGTSFL